MTSPQNSPVDSAHPEQKLSAFIESAMRIAARHSLQFSDVIQAKTAMELERQNDISVANAASASKQAAALAAAVVGVGAALRHFSDTVDHLARDSK